MKVYTISDSHVSRGAVLYAGNIKQPAGKRTILIGGGTHSKEIPMFKKNPPEIDMSGNKPYGGIITDAHPVKVEGGYALAKPNRESNKVLVVVSSRAIASNGSRRVSGNWSFDSKTTQTSDAMDQTLIRATGPKNYYGDQSSDENIGWRDALVVMKVGDIITVIDQNGDPAHVKYESVEKGLVVDTRVRMVLDDYDGAPDGVGTYTKLNAIFPSKKDALHHRARFMANMYWGRIETLDGTLVQWIEERDGDWGY